MNKNQIDEDQKNHINVIYQTHVGKVKKNKANHIKNEAHRPIKA
jgi:hypothetical protein